MCFLALHAWWSFLQYAFGGLPCSTHLVVFLAVHFLCAPLHYTLCDLPCSALLCFLAIQAWWFTLQYTLGGFPCSTRLVCFLAVHVWWFSLQDTLGVLPCSTSLVAFFAVHAGCASLQPTHSHSFTQANANADGDQEVYSMNSTCVHLHGLKCARVQLPIARIAKCDPSRIASPKKSHAEVGGIHTCTGNTEGEGMYFRYGNFGSSRRNRACSWHARVSVDQSPWGPGVVITAGVLLREQPPACWQGLGALHVLQV